MKLRRQLNKWLLFFCCSILALYVQSPEAGRSFRKIDVKGPLQEQLNNLLELSSELHEAAFLRDEKKIEESVSELLDSIQLAIRKSRSVSSGTPHVRKMLDAAKSALESTRNKTGEQRSDSLKASFNALVQIAQIFNLDSSYRIFFCRHDRAVWLQKSWKAKNPIHPVNYTNCGKLVR